MASRTTPTITADSQTGSTRASAAIAAAISAASPNSATTPAAPARPTPAADPLALAVQLGTGQLQLAAPQLGDLLGQPAHQLAGGGLFEVGSIAAHLRLV